MTLGYEFSAASGPSQIDCHWLGHRFVAELGFSPEQGDSWIGQMIGGNCHSLLTQEGWMTGIWRTDSRVWVSEAGGRVFMNPSLEPRREEWLTFRLDASLSGVWGLRDDLVFAWGMRLSGPVAFLFDGDAWREIGTPGHICAIHGVRDDLIHAVGHGGFVARWNGREFRTIHGPDGDDLRSVFTVSGEEIYACGPSGRLLRGNAGGWDLLLQHDGPLFCVAWWLGSVWVGTGPGGLARLSGSTLEVVKQNIHAERFDARGKLLVTAPDMIAGTEDGAGYQASFVKNLEVLSACVPACWAEEAEEDFLDEAEDD